MTRVESMLIVEDEAQQASHYLKTAKEAGFDAVLVLSEAEAIANLRARSFSLLLTDIHLSGSGCHNSFEGFNILRIAKEESPETIAIAMSADPDTATYEKAIQAGAWHFTKKPIRSAQELLVDVAAARDRRLLERARAALAGAETTSKLDENLEFGVVFPKRLREMAKKLAAVPQIAVTLRGETGTGKEEFAKVLHKNRCLRERRAIPFVPVNCAHLDSDVAMATLFGHVKGAFTGADKTTTGLVGEAHEGILFLDEVHALTLPVQQKLLRVLNDGSYSRVGDTKVIHSQFQVVCASTRDLDDEVEAGRFLLDLRTRLTGYDVILPPLRERRDEIPFFVILFLAKEGVEVSPEETARIVERCQRYYWQGNVRLLMKVLQSMVLTATLHEEPIRAEHLPELRTMLPPAGSATAAPKGISHPSPQLGEADKSLISETILRPLQENFNFESALAAYERFLLQIALSRHEKPQEAAAAVGLPRSTLDSKRKKHGL